MKRILYPLAALIALTLATGCGSYNYKADLADALPPVGTPSEEGVVVKGRILYEVSTGSSPSAALRLFNSLLPSALAASVTTPVSTTLAASTSFAINTSLFVVPASPTPFAVSDFGYLQVGDLKDNKLNVCGTSGNQHCGKALIRIYTTGTAAAGLYNTVDAYGAPITAGQTTLASVGLNTAGAATMQQITLPANKHTVMLADFTNPKYNMKVDFTSAGMGAYASTVVVEYALAP